MRVLGVVDSGISWAVTKSGFEVHTTPEWAEMLAAAGRDFDVLVLAYQSRLGRNTEEITRAMRLIHQAGAFLYFAEEERDTRSEQAQEDARTQAASDENYRSRLARTMRRTYASRHRRRGLPGGRPPFGYTTDWSIDPEAATTIRAIFSAYAAGNVSIEQLAAAHSLEPEALKHTLRNRTYLGLAIQNGVELPGTFPAIIEPELFDRVASVRANRRRAGGNTTTRHSMLKRRLWCQCGTPIRLDGKDRQQHWRVRHVDPCDAWGRHERKRAAHFEAALRQALLNIRLTDEAIDRMVSGGARTPLAPVSTLDNARARKRLRDAYDAGTIDATVYIAQDAELKAQTVTPAPTPQVPDAEYLRAVLVDFRGTLERASGFPFGNEVWANVAARYIERIEYLGPNELGIVPTLEGQTAITPGTLPTGVALAPPEGSTAPHTTLTVLLADSHSHP